MAKRSHPFPCRTRKLSSSAPMVVGGSPPVRVGRCQARPLFGAIVLLNYIGPLVKRLRHRPFTAVTRVRIPYGSPLIYWRISSAGRAPALQAGGRRFDPVILHHIYCCSLTGRERMNNLLGLLQAYRLKSILNKLAEIGMTVFTGYLLQNRF
jgi:hypothetical protein